LSVESIESENETYSSQLSVSHRGVDILLGSDVVANFDLIANQSNVLFVGELLPVTGLRCHVLRHMLTNQVRHVLLLDQGPLGFVFVFCCFRFLFHLLFEGALDPLDTPLFPILGNLGRALIVRVLISSKTPSFPVLSGHKDMV
jgi:hypothetical protein